MPESLEDMKIGSIHETKDFGLLEVLEYVNAFKVRVRFIKTGYETWALAGNIRNGCVKDKLLPTVYGVGFFGVGHHKSTKGGRPNKAYKVWQSMLQRCYDPGFHSRRPTYIGCSVCDEWKNFQVFADWFYDKYPTDGRSYQLDKDIIKDGNKVYCPEFCKFVTLKENTAKAGEKLRVFTNPNGENVEIYNLSDFCKQNNLAYDGMRKLGNGKNKKHKGWERYE